ncbi:S-methyl-5-thioribose-1-phosphate isomerase [Methanocella arvoryzae]|uniref:Putative methylthioribose-1-phosphate isomerase n=1 Tax=Methanocella arvoryzae (strain DSM 22066 / NBRC 105507 / MRE50) TaxID=351160 RepID=Q0W2L6_METAR|nr:S-methyl-5-thioribose-1-phosphate isomerase [Methanocella arvoryzae]CAJ37377.1 translation initiation factor 2B, subunit 1 [Methanocella arvoryzae MRE50]
MRTIDWDQKKNCVTIIDQTLLPEKLALLEIRDLQSLIEAIITLRVRGAPALGAAGGYGVALIARNIKAKDVPGFVKQLRAEALKLKNARPTAVNLSWGVERVLDRALDADNVQDIRNIALEEAKMLAEDDVQRCREIGMHGAELLKDGDTVLTHCNAGRLACVDWGTALGVIRSAVEAGKNIKVISCETRPLNQGSRLTAWELAEDKIPVTLIADDMAGYVMRKKLVDAVIVGADRIVEDAVFNKIGTYTHSVLAKAHGIPFYVAAPLSTFDFRRKEADVVIEERDPDELRKCGSRMLAPAGVPVLNPAFDATPMENVTALITEEGVFRPPFDFKAIEKLKM